MSAQRDAEEPSGVTSRGPRPTRAVVVAAAVVVVVACASVLLILYAAHGHRRGSMSKAPRFVTVDVFPASSPDLSVAKREIDVYIKDSATPAQIGALKAKIGALPQVELYTYISKDEAVNVWIERSREKNETVNVYSLGFHPMPGSFEMLVRDPRTEQAVAERFFNDPIVNNSPGQHDGVVYWQPRFP